MIPIEAATAHGVLVANVPLRHPEGELFSSVVVEGGFNVADDWLAEQADNPDALAMVVWQGKPLVEETTDGPRLAWLALQQDELPDAVVRA